MVKDAQGHALSGASADAVPLYDQAVRAFNLLHGDPMGQFDAAATAAPDFAMAHLGKAWALAMAHDPAFVAPATALVDKVSALSLNDRERMHLAALRLHLQGARAASVGVLERHLMSYPFDLLAHHYAMATDGFMGRFPHVQGRTARALPLWSKDQPGYGLLLGLYGFALEEAGDYAHAEEQSRAAADLEPLSWWPQHAVAHVMEMTGRPEDGLGWMIAREAFWTTPEHFSQTHFWWHKALFHLELGQYDEALSLYDEPIFGMQQKRQVGINLTNGSSLLWRLDTLGCEIGNRWKDLLAFWEGHADGRCLAFSDVHAAMAEMRAGREVLVEKRLATMKDSAASDLEAATLYRDVAIPLVEGFLAFHQGRYDRSVELLLPVLIPLVRLGGSHAQRDIVHWTATEAANRAGLRDTALALSNERLALRPRSVPNRRFLQEATRIAH